MLAGSVEVSHPLRRNQGPGVTREWFSAVAKELLNPACGLFLPCASSAHLYVPNAVSGVANPNHLSYFRMAGRVLAVRRSSRMPCWY